MAKKWVPSDNGFVNDKGEIGVWVDDKPTVPEPIYNAGKGSGAGTSDSYMALLNQMKAAQQAEYDRQRRDYERQQEQLRAQLIAVKNSRDNQINQAFNNSKKNLDTAKGNSLKDSYVAYMRGQKVMPQVAAVGGNGGYAQSLANKQQLNYENNRSSIQQNYLDNLRQLEQDRAAGLAANEENYLNGIMGLETNAQKYLDQLNALQKDDASYATQMAGLIKSAVPSGVSKSETANFTGKYRVGDKTMSRQEMINYLIDYGMTPQQAADYLANNAIPY